MSQKESVDYIWKDASATQTPSTSSLTNNDYTYIETLCCKPESVPLDSTYADVLDLIVEKYRLVKSLIFDRNC